AVSVQEGRQRDRDEFVARYAEDRALRFRHAHDLERASVNLDLLADGRTRGEESVGHVRPDETDRAVAQLLRLCERAAFSDVFVLNVDQLGRDRLQADAVKSLCAKFQLALRLFLPAYIFDRAAAGGL